MRFIGNQAPLAAFTPAQKVVEMMQKDFGFPLKDRLVAIPEVDMYRIKEDQSVYEQVKTEKYEYQVMFDGEFVCFFNTSEHPQRIRINILKGLKDLYARGKIFWDKKRYAEQQQLAKDQLKRDKADAEAKRPKATTSEEKIVHEALKRAVTN